MNNFIDDLLTETDEGRREVVRARLRIAVTEELLLRMETSGVSKARLAALMGVTRSAITQILSTRNLSLNKLADMAEALDLVPHFHLASKTPTAASAAVWRAPIIKMPMVGSRYSDFFVDIPGQPQNAETVDVLMNAASNYVRLAETV